MEFLNVSPVALRQHWPQIVGSLDAVIARAPEDWIKEDVYHAIRSGGAACHLAYTDTYAGLLITTISRAEYTGEQSLHVWIAHNAGSADVIEGGIELLRQMARHAGFKRITFASPRKGWARRFPLVSATYEVPL